MPAWWLALTATIRAIRCSVNAEHDSNINRIDEYNECSQN